MRTAAPIAFAGSRLAEARHVCAFFNSDEEEFRVLLPIIKEGFECGLKAAHVIGGILQRDPFFVPPAVFLREFRERRAGRNASTSTGS